MKKRTKVILLSTLAASCGKVEPDNGDWNESKPDTAVSREQGGGGYYGRPFYSPYPYWYYYGMGPSFHTPMVYRAPEAGFIHSSSPSQSVSHRGGFGSTARGSGG